MSIIVRCGCDQKQISVGHLHADTAYSSRVAGISFEPTALIPDKSTEQEKVAQLFVFVGTLPFSVQEFHCLGTTVAETEMHNVL